MTDRVWVGMILVSLIFSLARGRGEALTNALLQGSQDAVTLILSLTGAMCLFGGLAAMLHDCGAAGKLAKLASPLLKRLFPDADERAQAAVAACVSANLLGMSNAATPLGLQAAKLLEDGSERASTGLCTLVILSSTSLTLLPTTVTALRVSLGAANPYDILPAVWLTSAVSCAAALAAGSRLRRLEHRHGGRKR